MWHTKYMNDVVKGIKKNDAELKYGVHITRDFHIRVDKPYFEVMLVHHLLPEENRGQHNLFFDIIGLDGKRMTGQEVEIRNINNAISYARIDKGIGEPGGNAPIWIQDTLSIRIPNVDSDIVRGIHTRHDDEPGGNTRGHHSFYVIFQYRNGLVVPENPEQPHLPPLKELFTPDELFAISNFPLQKIKELVK